VKSVKSGVVSLSVVKSWEEGTCPLGKGYDPDYGARPLKRLIQKEIQDRMALAILEGRIADGTEVKVDHGKKDRTFRCDKK